MAKDLGCEIGALVRRRVAIELKRYVGNAADKPALRTIVDALVRSGRDPRKEFGPLRWGGRQHDQLGAFVDIGVHRPSTAAIHPKRVRWTRPRFLGTIFRYFGAPASLTCEAPQQTSPRD